LALKLKKKISLKLGGRFTTLGADVLAFIGFALHRHYGNTFWTSIGVEESKVD
jgi:hypothetical protein